MIFDDKCRTGERPILRGENLYDFYDRIRGKAFDAYRSTINTWVAHIPEDSSREIIARLRGGDDLNYETALSEVIIHEMFLQLSYSPRWHPELTDSTSRPDFLITDAKCNPVAYVEVTTINPPSTEVGRDNREGVIFEALNSLDMAPDLRLIYSVNEYGAASPSVSKLTRTVLDWANENADEARIGRHIQKDFTISDWSFDLVLVGGASERPDARRIAIWGDISGSFSGELRSPDGLRKALDAKARKYGEACKPYVIVVFDRTESLAWFESDFAENVASVLFGTEVYEEIKTEHGDWIKRHRRDTDGWFGYPEKPCHTNVSAVIVFPEVSIWKFSEKRGQPLLINNPWADFKLSESFLPLRYLEMTKENGSVKAGDLMSNIFEFPSPWPVSEET